MQIDLCAQEQINPWAQAQINPWSQVQIDPWPRRISILEPSLGSTLEPNEPRCRLTLEPRWWWFMSPYTDFEPCNTLIYIKWIGIGEWWSLFLIILHQYINIVAIRFTVHRGSWFDMITLVHAQFYTQDLNVSSFVLQKNCDTSQLWVMYRVVIYGKIKYGLMRSKMTING